MHDQVIGLINKTIDVLERDGWNRHSYFAADGSHCLVGALMVAAGYLSHDEYRFAADKTLVTRTYSLLGNHLQTRTSEGWNDCDAINMTEVIEMLNHLKFHLQREMAAIAQRTPVPETVA